MSRSTAPIPAPHAQPFQAGVQHPDLWLWDSWTLQGVEGGLHLYCLLTGLEHMFGSSLVDHHMSRGMLSLLGPYTEQASPGKQLSFPMIRNLDVTPAFRPA